MLFNCFSCARKISSKKDICVYCKTDISDVTIDLLSIRTRGHNKLKAKYRETIPFLVGRGIKNSD